jgi:hypothetical protein
VFYTPTSEEIEWADEITGSDEALLGMVLALKCYQRMGRFPRDEEIPELVIDNVPTRSVSPTTERFLQTQTAICISLQSDRADAIAGSGPAVGETHDRARTCAIADACHAQATAGERERSEPAGNLLHGSGIEVEPVTRYLAGLRAERYESTHVPQLWHCAGSGGLVATGRGLGVRPGPRWTFWSVR